MIQIFSIILSLGILFCVDYSKETISVAPFSNTTQKPEHNYINEALSDMITSDLSLIQELNIVSRKNLKEIIAEQQLIASSGLIDEESIQIGKILGATKIITGSYMIIKSTIRIDVSVIDIESGQIETSTNVKGRYSNFFMLQKKLVEKLCSKMGIEINDVEELVLMQTATQELDAMEKNYKGVQAYDENRIQDAIDYFNDALVIDPYYKAATKNLNNSKVKVEGKLLFADFSTQQNKKESQKEALILIIDEFNQNIWDIDIDSYNLVSDINNPDYAIIEVDAKFDINYRTAEKYIHDIHSISMGNKNITSKMGYEKYTVFPWQLYKWSSKNKLTNKMNNVTLFDDVLNSIISKASGTRNRVDAFGFHFTNVSIIAGDAESNILSEKEFKIALMPNSHSSPKPIKFSYGIDRYAQDYNPPFIKKFQLKVDTAEVGKISSIEIVKQ